MKPSEYHISFDHIVFVCNNLPWIVRFKILIFN